MTTAWDLPHDVITYAETKIAVYLYRSHKVVVLDTIDAKTLIKFILPMSPGPLLRIN